MLLSEKPIKSKTLFQLLSFRMFTYYGTAAKSSDRWYNALEYRLRIVSSLKMKRCAKKKLLEIHLYVKGDNGGIVSTSLLDAVWHEKNKYNQKCQNK